MPVDPALASATATRTFFSAYFGGGVQKTFTRTGVTHKNPKKRNFACLKLDWNPHAPQVPGAPGLFFGGGQDDWDITETVLTCLESGKWLYVGEYRMGRSPRLTVDEWLSLKPQVSLGSTRRRCVEDVYRKSWLGRAVSRNSIGDGTLAPRLV